MYLEPVALIKSIFYGSCYVKFFTQFTSRFYTLLQKVWAFGNIENFNIPLAEFMCLQSSGSKKLCWPSALFADLDFLEQFWATPGGLLGRKVVRKTAMTPSLTKL